MNAKLTIILSVILSVILVFSFMQCSEKAPDVASLHKVLPMNAKWTWHRIFPLNAGFENWSISSRPDNWSEACGGNPLLSKRTSDPYFGLASLQMNGLTCVVQHFTAPANVIDPRDSVAFQVALGKFYGTWGTSVWHIRVCFSHDGSPGALGCTSVIYNENSQDSLLFTDHEWHLVDTLRHREYSENYSVDNISIQLWWQTNDENEISWDDFRLYSEGTLAPPAGRIVIEGASLQEDVVNLGVVVTANYDEEWAIELLYEDIETGEYHAAAESQIEGITEETGTIEFELNEEAYSLLAKNPRFLIKSYGSYSHINEVDDFYLEEE